jgi:hypothetical protein
MFAKDRPVKRVDLPNNHWVELQSLSKGYKEAIKSDIADIFKGVEFELKNGQPEYKDGTKLPDGFIKKLGEINDRKLAAAIKAWSSEQPINPETVQGLEEEAYNIILSKVNEMNELSTGERKN